MRKILETEKSMQVTLLGAGMVRSAIARYLVRETSFRVIAVDSNEPALERLKSDVSVIAELIRPLVG